VYKEIVLGNPHFLSKLIELYQAMSPTAYDFKKDPLGLRFWYECATRFEGDYPLNLVLPADPSAQDVKEVVMKICTHFKQLIENNGLHEHLYEDSTCLKRRRERAVQKLFFAIALTCCESNGLDISPETDAGRGAVDFKFSKGFTSRVLVEIKLSSNSYLVHGFTDQLAEYQKAEQTDQSVLLVIDVGGCSDTRWENFWRKVSDAKASCIRVPEVIYINGTKRPSASHV